MRRFLWASSARPAQGIRNAHGNFENHLSSQRTAAIRLGLALMSFVEGRKLTSVLEQPMDIRRFWHLFACVLLAFALAACPGSSSGGGGGGNDDDDAGGGQDVARDRNTTQDTTITPDASPDGTVTPDVTTDTGTSDTASDTGTTDATTTPDSSPDVDDGPQICVETLRLARQIPYTLIQLIRVTRDQWERTIRYEEDYEGPEVDSFADGYIDWDGAYTYAGGGPDAALAQLVSQEDFDSDGSFDQDVTRTYNENEDVTRTEMDGYETDTAIVQADGTIDEVWQYTYNEDGDTTTVTQDVTNPEAESNTWTFVYIDSASDLADGELDYISQNDGTDTWDYADYTYNNDGKLLVAAFQYDEAGMIDRRSGYEYRSGATADDRTQEWAWDWTDFDDDEDTYEGCTHYFFDDTGEQQLRRETYEEHGSAEEHLNTHADPIRITYYMWVGEGEDAQGYTHGVVIDADQTTGEPDGDPDYIVMYIYDADMELLRIEFFLPGVGVGSWEDEWEAGRSWEEEPALVYDVERELECHPAE